MDLFLFIAMFFVAAVYFMPSIGFSYKLCERIYKRSLFGKSAQQIQFFASLLLLPVSIAFFADYFMQGTLFAAQEFVGGNLPAFRHLFLSISCGGFALCVFSFAASKWFNKIFMHIVCALLGIALILALSYWLCNVGVLSFLHGSVNGFAQICMQFVTVVFIVPFGSPDAVGTGYFASVALLLNVVIFSLYFVVFGTFLFRNAMDYGRDYYSFILNRYGRALYGFSLLALLFEFSLIIFQPDFPPDFRPWIFRITEEFFRVLENIVSFSPSYTWWGVFSVYFFYQLVSFTLKRSFCLTQIPLRKKSYLIIACVLDFVFNAGLFAVIAGAGIV